MQLSNKSKKILTMHLWKVLGELHKHLGVGKCVEWTSECGLMLVLQCNMNLHVTYKTIKKSIV